MAVCAKQILKMTLIIANNNLLCMLMAMAAHTGFTYFVECSCTVAISSYASLLLDFGTVLLIVA